MTTMTAPARRSASAAYAAAFTEEHALPSRAPDDADQQRLQRRRDRRIVAAAEANWLLALR